MARLKFVSRLQGCTTLGLIILGIFAGHDTKKIMLNSSIISNLLLNSQCERISRRNRDVVLHKNALRIKELLGNLIFYMTLNSGQFSLTGKGKLKQQTCVSNAKYWEWFSVELFQFFKFDVVFFSVIEWLSRFHFTTFMYVLIFLCMY